MNLLNILNAIIVMFGLPALIGGCIYIGRNLQLLEDLKESLEELKKDFDDDYENLILMKAKIFGFSNSPMQPNQQGKELLQESGFNELYPKIKYKIFEELRAAGVRTLYDAEKRAMRALRKIDSDPLFDPLKTYAVNHPDKSLDVIFLVASWIIRDDFAGEYKEIK